MKCAVHTDVDAIGYCRNCGKALCATCARPVRDVFYCEDCLAGAVGLPTPPPPASPYAPGSAPASSFGTPSTPYAPPTAFPGPIPAQQRRGVYGSAAVAFVLGLFPGLGAVYNGEYNKALLHIVVFAAMIVGLSSDLGSGAEIALALLLAGFVFYMAFDSMRTAKAKQLGELPDDPLESWSKERPIGPIILIALGALFLLNNFNWFPFYRIERFWPLILIGVGVLMFRNRIGGR